ncbi:MAG TPA: DUF6263 family protein [Gemmatimonadaceae bacterium]|nr:DUF6263 family protein [Gemmatimonadaceae bacterium]
MAWRHARLLSAALTAIALCLSQLAAQGGGGAARQISLRIKPRVGDTIYTRFETQMEMVGSGKVGSSDTTVIERTSMLLLSRVMVLSGDDDATTVLTVTDSVAVTVSGGRKASPEEARRALQGQRVRMRITPEGSATLLDGPRGLSADFQSMVSQMPAMLPKQPVSVGETWAQMLTVPMARSADADEGATLYVVYRLDSLGYGGNVAHISMRGTITRDSTAADLPRGVKLLTTGSIVGHLAVDRRRGWWIRSEATYAMRSTFTPRRGGTGNPLQVVTTITQRMESRR